MAPGRSFVGTRDGRRRSRDCRRIHYRRVDPRRDHNARIDREGVRMIISRTPLRISLGGGGTDLPAYYKVAGHGFLIAAAINKYVYIAAHRNFDDDVLLKYSSVERVPKADYATHPLLRS